MKARLHLPDLDCHLIFKRCKNSPRLIPGGHSSLETSSHFQQESYSAIANRLEPSFCLDTRSLVVELLSLPCQPLFSPLTLAVEFLSSLQLYVCFMESFYGSGSGDLYFTNPSGGSRYHSIQFSGNTPEAPSNAGKWDGRLNMRQTKLSRTDCQSWIRRLRSC